MNTSSVATRPEGMRSTGQLPVTAAYEPARRDVRITWWYTFLSIASISVMLLIFFGLITATNLIEQGGPVWQAVTILILFLGSVVGCVVAAWLIRDGYGQGWPPLKSTLWLFAFPTLTWVVTLGIPVATIYGAMPVWILLTTLVPLVQRKHRVGLLFAGIMLFVLHGLINPGTGEFMTQKQVYPLTFVALFLALTYLVSAWLWHVVVRLHEARTVHSQLAVAQERLRFASDLHDIQGHHLQVIALQAELAQRFLKSGAPAQVEAAQTAIGQVRELAAEAQQETRQLVRDLRVVTLGEELRNAKDVLEAAGAATSVTASEHVVAKISVNTSRLLGLLVRESTTNMLRHAHPAAASFDLQSDGEQLRLDVINDGICQTPSGAETGTGLRGLAQRFEAAGGQLTVIEEDGLFTLRAVLPVQEVSE